MLKRGYLYLGEGFDPYQNIADEALILEQVEPGTLVLYLWQNAQTVVIGRNQNCWRECDVHRLEEEGGHLARRLSGGGAVYHDLGNLNFTFLVHAEDYDTGRQVEVIRQALLPLGLDVVASGRNDLLLDGRKFSGNAYYRTGDRCYHHGTILIDTDKDVMARYLRVSKNKMQSKGVESTRSRVINLVELAPNLTAEDLIPRLKQAASEVYGLDFEPWEFAADTDRLAKRAEFASPEWLYNHRSNLTILVDERFTWGEVQFEVEVAGDKIQELRLYSDAMAWDWTQDVHHLAGTAYKRSVFLPAWEAYLKDQDLTDAARQDLLRVGEQIFD